LEINKFIFLKKGQIWILECLVYENARCLLPEESSDRCERIDHKSSKM
jgi:hypothetical protein